MMSMSVISRRAFLTLCLPLVLSRHRRAFAGGGVLRGSYAADVGILYDMLNLQLRGSIDEVVDRDGGKYRVTATGAGAGIANRFESAGVLRGGRWVPLRSESWFDIRGRQSRTDIVYDWHKKQIEFHARGETFFLRRVRVVDDVLSITDGLHVDDVMSAALNYADGRWQPDSGGTYRTLIVRRRRSDSEGPDDVDVSYRAEIVSLDLTAAPAASGKTTALFDLSRFSSWARPSHPARIVFGHTRRPELITSSMILGTSVTIRFIGL
jgi:hypothetical protein